MKIKTENVCPPIPIRSLDWQAWDDDTYDGMPGSPLGTGSTEEEAIRDLLDQLDLEEDAEQDEYDRRDNL